MQTLYTSSSDCSHIRSETPCLATLTPAHEQHQTMRPPVLTGDRSPAAERPKLHLDAELARSCSFPLALFRCVGPAGSRPQIQQSPARPVPTLRHPAWTASGTLRLPSSSPPPWLRPSLRPSCWRQHSSTACPVRDRTRSSSRRSKIHARPGVPSVPVVRRRSWPGPQARARASFAQSLPSSPERNGGRE